MENDNDNILEDVLIQILVLLPVISLLRFKSVCKSWRALIQTSFFIDLHLNTTTTTNKNSNLGTFIFQTSRGYLLRRDNEAFMLSSGGSGSGSGSGSGEEEEEELIRLEDLGFPSCYKASPSFDYLYIVGSCNGLICIHDTKRRDVALWNPATRQFRLLPRSSFLEEEEEDEEDLAQEEFAAFGYDVETKDYKVVLISHFRPHNMSDDSWFCVKEYIFRVQVYSLIQDCWKVIEEEEGINSFPVSVLPYAVISMNHGVYLKGSYYFLGRYLVEFGEEFRGTTSHTVILSFDFTKEIFTTIHLPHSPNYHQPNTISTYQGEKLAVFARVVVEEYDSDSETFEIWVLNDEEHHGVVFFKEEEVEESSSSSSSWTKLHELYSDGRPRGISNDGVFAFIGTGSSVEINGAWVYGGDKLELFNLVTKEVKMKFSTPQEVITADVYNQSLVSIGGGNVGTT